MSKTIFQNKDMNLIIRHEVVKALRDILEDPDFGLELTEYAKKRIRQAQKSKGKGIPLPKIKRKYY